MITCSLCQGAAVEIGKATGSRSGRGFDLCRCPACEFTFVANPWEDYEQIYDEAYYAGKGSDPLIDYAFEFECGEESVRAYEWLGWHQLVREIYPQPVKWLDFGCGCATLVRAIARRGFDEIHGFDTGVWAGKARAAGLPILSREELELQAGTFDLITAIDVIEHVVRPLEMLALCRRLLKPGGILIPMTGNAVIAPKGNFAAWSYVRPEIHVSFFTPRAMERALSRSGFEAMALPRKQGWRNILRARVLKNLGVKRQNFVEKALPWPVLSALADARVKMGELPIGKAV